MFSTIEHTCGRPTCRSREKAPDDKLGRCAKCNMKLWSKPIVRAIRFRDLRHTTASLLMMAGANPAAVQKIMRHSSPTITTQVCGHLSPDYLKGEIDRLKLLPQTKSNVTYLLPAAKTAALTPSSDKKIPIHLAVLKVCARTESNRRPLSSKPNALSS